MIADQWIPLDVVAEKTSRLPFIRNKTLLFATTKYWLPQKLDQSTSSARIPGIPQESQTEAEGSEADRSNSAAEDPNETGNLTLQKTPHGHKVVVHRVFLLSPTKWSSFPDTRQDLRYGVTLAKAVMAGLIHGYPSDRCAMIVFSMEGWG